MANAAGAASRVSQPHLIVHVREARNLRKADVLSESDPYVELRVQEHLQRTHVIDNTPAPKWCSSFVFLLSGRYENESLRMVIWDDDLVGRDYLGEVVVPLGTLKDQAPHWRWLPLIDGRARASRKTKVTGDLHVQVQMVVEDARDFPESVEVACLQSYRPLYSLVTQVLPVSEAVVELVPTGSQTDLSFAMVDIHLASGTLSQFLALAIDQEVNFCDTSEATLFRGNTMVTKMVKLAWSQLGNAWMFDVLRPTIELVTRNVKSGVSYEVDVGMTGCKDPHLAATRLTQALDSLLDSLSAGVDDAPNIVRHVIWALIDSVSDRFPHAQYRGVTNFLLLRFLGPVLVQPTVYGLLDAVPTPPARRGLILLSKLLQGVGNHVEFSDKEQGLALLNPAVRSGFKRITRIYDALAVKPPAVDLTPISAMPESRRESGGSKRRGSGKKPSGSSSRGSSRSRGSRKARSIAGRGAMSDTEEASGGASKRRGGSKTRRGASERSSRSSRRDDRKAKGKDHGDSGGKNERSGSSGRKERRGSGGKKDRRSSTGKKDRRGSTGKKERRSSTAGGEAGLGVVGDSPSVLVRTGSLSGNSRARSSSRERRESLSSPQAKAQAQLESKTIRHMGWLHKEGEDPLKLWKKRWFVLQGQELKYYKKKPINPESDEPRGSIPLSLFRIDIASEKLGKRQFVFKLIGHPRTYYLAADNKQEMARWMDAVIEVMNTIFEASFDDTTVFGGAGMPPPARSDPVPRLGSSKNLHHNSMGRRGTTREGHTLAGPLAVQLKSMVTLHSLLLRYWDAIAEWLSHFQQESWDGLARDGVVDEAQRLLKELGDPPVSSRPPAAATIDLAQVKAVGGSMILTENESERDLHLRSALNYLNDEDLSAAAAASAKAVRSSVQLAEQLATRALQLYRQHLLPDGEHVEEQPVDWRSMATGPEFEAFQQLAWQLIQVDPSAIPVEDRAAFFINVHNALAVHALAVHGFHIETYLRRRNFFASASYIIGGEVYSLALIQTAVLAGNPTCVTRRGLVLSDADPRCAACVPVDPRYPFTLCHFATDSPQMVVYSTGPKLGQQLDLAVRRYLVGRVTIYNDDVRLPNLMKQYQVSFSASREPNDLVNFILPHVDKPVAAAICKAQSSGTVSVSYEPFQWKAAGRFAVVRRRTKRR